MKQRIITPEELGIAGVVPQKSLNVEDNVFHSSDKKHAQFRDLLEHSKLVPIKADQLKLYKCPLRCSFFN